jgi:hypothetical protein
LGCLVPGGSGGANGITNERPEEIIAADVHEASDARGSQPLYDLLSQEFEDKRPEEIDDLVRVKLGCLRMQYRLFGNPILIYNAGQSLAMLVKQRWKKPGEPFGQLLLFLGELLINSGIDAPTVGHAQQHLETALPILAQRRASRGQSLGDYLRACWLRAVAIKMQGGFDEALRSVNDALTDKTVSKLATIRETIPLERQKVIMEQTAKAHTTLEATLPGYERDAVEQYRSLKRLFEFSLNTRNALSVERLYEKTRTAFRKALPHLDQISRISYYKNLYQYHRTMRNGRIAGGIFSFVTQEAVRLDLWGQHRQIVRMKELFDLERKGKAMVRLPVAVF